MSLLFYLLRSPTGTYVSDDVPAAPYFLLASNKKEPSIHPTFKIFHQIRSASVATNLSHRECDSRIPHVCQYRTHLLGTMTFQQVLVLSCLIALAPTCVYGFAFCQSRHHATTARYANDGNNENEKSNVSRSDFMSTCLTSLGTSTAAILFKSAPALASEHEISECKMSTSGGPTNCISTASVKLVSCYSPPWTFEVPPSEAMARLKGVVATDPTLELLEEDDGYLKVRATRNLVTDELEFLVNQADQVVMFRSAEQGEGVMSDFGANKSRLESIRKKAGVFGVMGEGLTADSFEGSRGNGPLGQLKAFYGLQSGQGFEDVFEE